MGTPVSRRNCLLLLLPAALQSAAGSSIGPGVLDVPLVRQLKEGCGAAALAMVIEYWRAARPDLELPPADAQDLYRKLYSREEKGIAAASLIRHLQECGFHALPLRASRMDLENHLAKGRPMIAAIRDGSRLHYVVVRGIEPGAVWVNDPWDGKPHRIAWRSFDEQWRGGARWLLLAVPRG